MKVTAYVTVGSMAIAAFLIGRCSVGRPDAEPEPAHDHAAEQQAEPDYWSCSMHPQIRLPQAGPCPICFMDLIPVYPGATQTGPRALAMSAEDKKLAEIITAPVERRFVSRRVRMVGKLDFDETAVRAISIRVPGWLERLYVDYTGIPVQKGDHLVSLYSPDLLTAQEELLEARRWLDREEPVVSLRRSNRKTYESARIKLRLLGLTESQLDGIEERGSAEDHVLLRSPIEGVVIEKLMNEGDHVQAGARVYRIADLRKLWLNLDAYEQDLAWLRYGQLVEIETEASPGRTFEGWITFLSPVLDERTRTVKVRVVVENEERLLKPGMFARAVVRSRIASAGKVMDARLAGKWISPMHPEIVKDGPGKCDVCGMDLVPAEQLGFTAATEPADKPLVVPVTAVLRTGQRAVVYVELQDQERPTYEGREVTLGPRADEHYVVLDGLREGERVVVNGAFKIDSALQLQAKPSMMSMPGERVLGAHGERFRAALAPLFAAYLDLQVALSADDEAAARSAVDAFASVLAAVDGAGLPAKASQAWIEERDALRTALGRDAPDIEALRRVFDALSGGVISLERDFGHPGAVAYEEVFCPMAFEGRGASWLQVGAEVANPYFGASMLRCGTVRRSWPGAGGADAQPEHDARDDRGAAAFDPHAGHGHAAVVPASAAALTPVYDAYLAAWRALADDGNDGAREAFATLATALQGVDHAAFGDGAAHATWMRLQTVLGRAARAGAATADIAVARERFRDASGAILELHDAFGHAGATVWFETFCPMAFDDTGARWLQVGEAIHNPYFGHQMLRCGTVERRLEGTGARERR